jgi:hypothetical protein
VVQGLFRHAEPAETTISYHSHACDRLRHEPRALEEARSANEELLDLFRREGTISGDEWLLFGTCVAQSGVCGGVSGSQVPWCADMH